MGLRSASLTNDLRVPFEVQWANQEWQVVYPARELATPPKISEVHMRLCEAHAIVGTCSVVPGVTILPARNLPQFYTAAKAWIQKDSDSVQHERDRQRNRRKMSCMLYDGDRA